MTILEHYQNIGPFANQSNFWRDFFIAMVQTWKKLKTSNMFKTDASIQKCYNFLHA